jgi:5'-nucleotidase
MQTWLVWLPIVVAGCSGLDRTEDGEDDSFGPSGKADGSESTAETCAVLKLANLGTAEVLAAARVSDRPARNIITHRLGQDGVLDTEDDGWFASLQELDAIKYMGPANLQRMIDYVDAEPAYACGRVDVQLLGLNDLHGNLEPPDAQVRTASGWADAGGIEFLGTHLAALAQDNPNTTIVAAGDMIGGSPLLSGAFHDEPTIEALNLLGMSVTAVGNHEFDEGPAELLRMQRGGCHPVDGCQDGDAFSGAAFPLLAANVIDQATGETFLPPTAIRRYGGVRIGFIGLTLRGTPFNTTDAGTAGLTFRDEAETINELVPGLEARGVQSIVVLIHEGARQSGTYAECVGLSGPLLRIVERLDPAISVVVSGHSHVAYDCVIGDRLVTSAAHSGVVVTDIDLSLDERTGRIVAKDARNLVVTRDVPKHAAQSALLGRYQALIAPIANRVIGEIEGDLTRIPDAEGETTMGAVIADAQLESTRRTGAKVAFMNAAGVRNDLDGPGEVTYAEIFAVQPFSNHLVTVTLTGAQIERLLEQQFTSSSANILAISRGFTYTWSRTRAAGDKIDPSTIRIDGVVVDPAATYRVTANNFTAERGVFAEGTDRVSGPMDITSLEDRIRIRSPLRVPVLDRITATP